TFEEVSRRFRREGERGTHIDHEHMVRILAYCDNELGSAFRSHNPINPFIVMEYMAGRTLESYILSTPEDERGFFAINQPRLSIAIHLARALEYLKRRRLVHRDVKPANIFLAKISGQARWHAKVGDFGVMKWGDFHAAVATGRLTVTAQKG